MLIARRVAVLLDGDEDPGASESTQNMVAPPWPTCILCHRNPDSHALRGATLYCDSWGKDGAKGDFGPRTALVVASVYAAIGAKLPEGLRYEVVRLRNLGITDW